MSKQIYTILLVDDDDEVRMALRRLLCAYGHTVHEAQCAKEGASVLRQLKNQVDAVISDFDMPGGNGLDFLQHVRLSHPNTYRILLTGKSDIQVAARALNEGSAHRFLLKPWSQVDVVGILDIVLRSRKTQTSELQS